jgi:hypothetical protein
MRFVFYKRVTRRQICPPGMKFQSTKIPCLLFRDEGPANTELQDAEADGGDLYPRGGQIAPLGAWRGGGFLQTHIAASIARISPLGRQVLRRILLGLMAGAGAGGAPSRTARGRRRGASRRARTRRSGRLGAEDPLAAKDCRGRGGAGHPGVHQINGQAEPPFEVLLLGLLPPPAGAAEQVPPRSGVARREGAKLPFDLSVREDPGRSAFHGRQATLMVRMSILFAISPKRP